MKKNLRDFAADMRQPTYCGQMLSPEDVADASDRDIETPMLFYCRLRTDIASRPEWYFCRSQLPMPKAARVAAEHDVWQWSGVIRNAERNNVWPRSTSSCTMFSRCPYFDLCSGYWDHSADRLPPAYVQDDNVHPELSEEESP